MHGRYYCASLKGCVFFPHSYLNCILKQWNRATEHVNTGTGAAGNHEGIYMHMQ